MKKKKFNTVAEVAQEIGLNHLALRLLEYLDQYHPDLALDYDFIMDRASYAAAVREKMEQNGLLQEADCEANNILMADLEFSEHSIILNIVDDYYYDKADTRSYEEVCSIAIELRPKLKSIFAKYPTDDPEFPASCEYDQLVAKLTKKIEKLLQKRDELPF